MRVERIFFILAAVIGAGSFAGMEIQAPLLTAVIGVSGDEVRLIEGKQQHRPRNGFL